MICHLRAISIRVAFSRVLHPIIGCMMLLVTVMCSSCLPSQAQQEEVLLQPSEYTSQFFPETERFSSAELGISFTIPKGWVVEETDKTIYLAKSSADLPWGADYFLTPTPEPYFELYLAPAYLSSTEQIRGKTRSVEELAQEIAYSFEVGPVRGRLIGQIGIQTVNGADVSTLLIDTGGLYSYVMVRKLSEGMAVVVNGIGAPNSEAILMDVSNIIVHSLREQ